MTTAATNAADIRAVVEEALRADRARQAGIRTCAEAKDRPTLAEHLALNTELTVEQAQSILATAAKEPAATRNAFREAMDRTPNPNLGPDNGGNGGGEGGGGEDDTPEAKANRILTAFGKRTGTKPKLIEHRAA